MSLPMSYCLKIPRPLIACLLATALAAGAGCGKKDEASAGALVLSGKLGSGLNGARFDLTQELMRLLEGPGQNTWAMAATQANSVIAIPLYQGTLTAWAMPYAVSGTVDSSGNLSISLTKEQDYVVLLLDTSQTRKIDQVVGYLNLADASKGLMRIPSQSAKGSSMDVGTITQANGSKSSTSSQTLSDLSEQFTVNLGVLRELARTDDILQIAKNIYHNFRSSSDFADTSPYFAFNGDQADIINAFSSPASIPYSGYGLYFQLAKPGLKLGDVCAASGAKMLKLTPPAQITSAVDPQQGGVGTPFNYVDSTGTTAATPAGGESWCGAPHNLGLGAGSIYIHGDPAKEQFGFNWGAGTGFAGSVAAGEWVLSLDNAEIGRFDLQAANVVDGQGHALVYVPSIKMETSNGLVTKITVKLYTWDAATSSYVAVTDTTGFTSSTKYASMEITDYGQSPRVSKNYEVVAQADGTFTVTNFNGVAWKQGTYGDGTVQNPATTSVTFYYQLYGASMRFDFRN